MESYLKKLGSISYPSIAIMQKLHPFWNTSKMLRTQQDSNTTEARTISLSFDI